MDIIIPSQAPPGIMLAEGLGHRVAVAVRFSDDGTNAVRDTEAGACRLRAHAALSVTDRRPSEAVVNYCHESRRQGRPLDAVIRTGAKHDGELKRALVSLLA